MYDITIHVEDEKDLYNSFDSSRETLSDDFVSYIEEQLEGRKIIENVQLILRSDNPIDSNQLEKALDSFLEARRKALDRDKRIKKWESIRLMVIGCFFVVIGIMFAEKFTSVVSAIV